MAGVAAGLGILLTILARSQLFTVAVAGESMAPALLPDEIVLCTRVWPKRWLRPGAIAVLRGYGGVSAERSIAGAADALLIKRIAHCPGSTVAISPADVATVPACYRGWTTRLVTSSRGSEWNLVLRGDEVFVMSDRRDNGLDSRTFGPVPMRALVGLVVRRVETRALDGGDSTRVGKPTSLIASREAGPG